MRSACLLLLAVVACSPVPTVVDADGDGARADVDCDDADPTVHPDATERCDELGIDEDCDGLVNADDPDVADRVNLHPDADGDGYGDPGSFATCPGPGWTTDASDCDDADPAVHPGVPEVCDLGGVDEDCDGAVNGADPDATAPLTWYTDADGDGWGGPESMVACDRPGGTVSDPGDCDDADAARHPGAAERCDGADDDCDGAVDEGVTATVWADVDLDGYGDPTASAEGCPLSGWAANDDDCDDTDPDTHPDALERCADGVDQDCDGTPSQCDLDGERSAPDADATFAGPAVDDHVGATVAGVGDVDGDGRADWMVGGPTSNTSTSLGGAAWLFRGGVAGDLSPGLAAARFVTTGDGTSVGSAVLGLGDIDGDGFADVALGASGAATSGVRGGAVAVFLGPVLGDVDFADADAAVTGEESLGQLGNRLADGHDADGDGAPDLFVAAPAEDAGGTDRGSVYLLPPPTSGRAPTSVAATAWVYGDRDDQALGRVLAGPGDLDGDGVGDLALGDPDAQSGLGAVYVFAGPLVDSHAVSDADHTLVGADASGQAGATLAGPGDLDGDGRADLAFGAPLADASDFESGAVYVVYGPVDGAVGAADADLTCTGMERWEHAGSSLAPAGDVDRDGVPDLLLRAEGWPSGDGTGKVYVVSGAETGTVSVATARLAVPGDQPGFGEGLASAGDTDGDGTVDLLLTNPLSNLSATGGGAVFLFLDRGW